MAQKFDPDKFPSLVYAYSSLISQNILPLFMLLFVSESIK